MLDPCSHSGVLSLTTHGRGAFLQFGFVTLLEEAVLVLEVRLPHLEVIRSTVLIIKGVRD